MSETFDAGTGIKVEGLVFGEQIAVDLLEERRKRKEAKLEIARKSESSLILLSSWNGMCLPVPKSGLIRSFSVFTASYVITPRQCQTVVLVLVRE